MFMTRTGLQTILVAGTNVSLACGYGRTLRKPQIKNVTMNLRFNLPPTANPNIFFSLSVNVKGLRFRVIVFYPTFNKISDISWRSVVLLEESGAPGENHPPVVSR